MSIRESIQEQFYNVCVDQGFNAPYGVLTNQESFGVKARTVTFGRPRTLDATVRIFGPTFIQVKTSRDRHHPIVFTGANAVVEAIHYVKSL